MTQVDTILAKPNYRQQKQQKEQARKLRQAEKQLRRMGAKADAARSTDAPENLPAGPQPPAAGQAES